KDPWPAAGAACPGFRRFSFLPVPSRHARHSRLALPRPPPPHFRNYFLQSLLTPSFTTFNRTVFLPFRFEISDVPFSSTDNCFEPICAEATFQPSGTRARSNVRAG